MSIEIFNKKGMLDLLLMLKEGKKTFTELKVLDISPSTLVARLRETQSKNLVKQILVQRKDKKSITKYSLTNIGKKSLALYNPIISDYSYLRKEIKR